MENEALLERMLRAWIGVSGLLKSSRITRELTYNEAIVMKLVYDQYKTDGTGRTAVRWIVQETNMRKSLCVLRPYHVSDLPDRRSLELVRQIADVVGPEDAETFVRMYEKLSAAGIRL